MDVKNLYLPIDLKKHVKKSIMKRVIPCVILFIIFGMILLLWGNRIFNTDNLGFKYFCYFLVMIVPFGVTGVPSKLKDKTYFGIVDKVDIITTHDLSSKIHAKQEMLYTKNTVYLNVMLPSGKELYTKVYEGKANLQQHLFTYQKGDTVFHLYGSKYTVILPKEADTNVQCAICGSNNDKEDSTCRNCGHSLIKEQNWG